MAGHVRRVCQVACFHIHSIAKIRNYLITVTCKTMHSLGLVMLRVDCSNTLLYGLRLCCISCRWTRILRRDSLLGPAEEITSHQFCSVFIRCHFPNELNYSKSFSSCIALARISELSSDTVLTLPFIEIRGQRQLTIPRYHLERYGRRSLAAPGQSDCLHVFSYVNNMF